MSGKESSLRSLRSRVLELERELLNMEEQLGKGECARINAYMQKHFNDILLSSTPFSLSHRRNVATKLRQHRPKLSQKPRTFTLKSSLHPLRKGKKTPECNPISLQNETNQK